jgi:pyruvate ferredoxin oxidoreductase gamma subunit
VFQVRIHGRGGQGVVTASEMLALAGFIEGCHAQAFPSFGSERTGAPVSSFVRLSDDPIRVHEPVMAPDAVIVQDVTLLNQIHVFAGLARDGYAIVNSTRSPAQLDICPELRHTHRDHVVTVPASEIATRWVGRPVPGAALLGAFAAVTGVVSIDSVVAAVEQRLPGPIGEENAAAASETYELVVRACARRLGAGRAPAG